MWSIPSLRLLTGLLWRGVVISIMVPSIGQIELFNRFLEIIIIIIIISCEQIVRIRKLDK